MTSPLPGGILAPPTGLLSTEHLSPGPESQQGGTWPAHADTGAPQYMTSQQQAVAAHHGHGPLCSHQAPVESRHEEASWTGPLLRAARRQAPPPCHVVRLLYSSRTMSLAHNTIVSFKASFEKCHIFDETKSYQV